MLEEHTGTREQYLVGEKDIDLLGQVDLLRLYASGTLERSQKAEAGQFLTPAPLARFLASRSAMVRYLQDISWETEVWVADHPTHLIHFDGEHLLGPDRN
jgi:hypothetical protein